MLKIELQDAFKYAYYIGTMRLTRCNSWYFENVMPLRVTWTKHTVLLAIGTKNTFQTICAFLALLFATIFASIPLYSFHLRSGSMNSASFACLPRIRRKMGMMDFYKNFEI